MERNLSQTISRRALLRQICLWIWNAGPGISPGGRIQAVGRLGSKNPLDPKPPHFAPTAKRVIFLFMQGGPSSIDTFNPRPRLTADHGKPVPFKRPLTFAEGDVGNLMKSPWEFKHYGQSGIR